MLDAHDLVRHPTRLADIELARPAAGRLDPIGTEPKTRELCADRCQDGGIAAQELQERATGVATGALDGGVLGHARLVPSTAV